MKRISFLALVGLLTAACLGSDFSDSLQGSWELTSGTLRGEPIPIIASHPITVTFDGDQVGGTASCNSYGGTFELSGSSIHFGDLAMTEMACFPDETMTAESMYGEALTLVDTAEIDEGLTLSGDGVELTFEALEPVPDAELTGVVWVLDGLISGDSVASPVQDTRATIEFFTDGSVLGDTGCRPFSGHYVVTGAEVQMTDLMADGNQCEAPFAEQDDQFIAVIGDKFRVEIEGSRLTTRAQGDEGLSFIAEG